MGAVDFILTILINFLNIYTVLLIVRVLLSWFQGSGWAEQIMSFLSPITDPYLNIFRSLIPPLGGMDFSPILAFLALQLLQNLLTVGAASLSASASF